MRMRPGHILRLCLALAWAATGVAAQEERIALASGRTVELYESFVPEEGAGLLYISFLAPWLAEAELPYEAAERDMAELCERVGLPASEEADEPVHEVVIRLLAAPLDYGEAAPELRQFAAVYDISSGGCRWQ